MSVYEFDGQIPQLPPQGEYFIAPTAAVVGRVFLARGVSVWFGAVIRGDNEPITIGSGSNIQDCVVVHSDWNFPVRIGKGVVIGHQAMVHGCIIGDNVLIGMSATIMNGVKIGNNCVIGAGALIPEGREIPDNSLVVGMPGKVLRKLNDDEAAKLTAGAHEYEELFKIYLGTMKKI